MCGIAGFLSPLSFQGDPEQTAKKMANAILHRGPDAEGISGEKQASYFRYFAHRRLSILELSPLGAQPMRSACGRYEIVFNGEIYNHLDLRKDLKQQFRGQSDTETLLAGIAQWGLALTLKKSIGMLALALWDKETKTLSLARDRFGEKPLYLYQKHGHFLFASELKALHQHPNFEKKVNEAAERNFLQSGFIPGNECIYEATSKIPPAHYCEIHAPSGKFSLHSYWDMSATAQRNSQLAVEVPASIERVEQTLVTALQQTLMSDVPIGAFLSGGIDSSLITALIAKHHRSNLKTFSVAFDVPGFNEAPFARAVAQHLKTDHTEITVTANDALQLVPQLGTIYDEPFADVSELPTLLLCQATKKYVTVALSGDGGDEIFSGYNRYIFGPALWNRIHRLPQFLRAPLSSLLRSSPARGLAKTLPFPQPEEKLRKLSELLGVKTLDDFYQTLVAPRTFGSANSFRKNSEPSFGSFAEKLQLLDCLEYLPNDILVKVDRAAMKFSLETRAPFLDPRVFEIAWQLPPQLKMANGKGKIALRQILANYVPEEIWDRPKTGFSPPIDEWLRGPLKEWAADALSARNLKNLPIDQPEKVEAAFSAHCKKQNNYGYRLWPILMAHDWRKTWL